MKAKKKRFATKLNYCVLGRNVRVYRIAADYRMLILQENRKEAIMLSGNLRE